MLHGPLWGIWNAMSPLNLLFGLIGCILGTLVGVLPGLGPASAVALLFPVTINLPAVPAIIMLGGIYYGAMYGGSTTSILMNIPGESSSVPTTFDGYEMAKQGRAGPALAISAIGSFVGGTLAIMALSFTGPLLASLLFYFTAPDYAGMMFFSLVSLATLSGGNVVPCVVEMYKAKPDGYTLMMDTNGASSIQAAIMRELPFKLEDRVFLTNFIINPTFYFCGANKPWKTLKEAGDYAKRDPANFKWAAMDISSTTTLSIIQFLDAIGVDISKTKKMDFKGGPDVMVAGANGEVDLANYGIGPALPLIESGRIRPLALISPQRIKRLPNLPTVREEGFPGLTAAQWCGVSGPPKLPKEIVAKWDQEMKKAASDPEFTASIEKLGMIMYYLPSDAYKKMVLDEMKIFTDLAQKIGVRPR